MALPFFPYTGLTIGLGSWGANSHRVCRRISSLLFLSLEVAAAALKPGPCRPLSKNVSSVTSKCHFDPSVVKSRSHVP